MSVKCIIYEISLIFMPYVIQTMNIFSSLSIMPFILFLISVFSNSLRSHRIGLAASTFVYFASYEQLMGRNKGRQKTDISLTKFVLSAVCLFHLHISFTLFFSNNFNFSPSLLYSVVFSMGIFQNFEIIFVLPSKDQ